ncbi:MAG: erythromycin esterase family protein [Bryobacteraceae bacterium]|jgi:erythromycin esterase
MVKSLLRTAALAAIALLSFGLAPTAQAAVDGQWVLTLPGAGALLLELKSDGGRLTGSATGPNGKLEIANGSIAGNAISFETVVTLNRGAGTVSLLYTGEIEGDEIHLTVGTRGPGPKLQATAKRRDPNAPPPDWFSEAPAPEEVVAWLKTNAIRLETVEPGSAFADMAPLKARLKDARVVAMGEATHGTREFSQFKHRMFQFLVEELGFTVIGVEGNWPESLKVNEYVLDGKGDPREALAGIYFSMWQTEEVLEMVRWMRQYNQDAAHTRKLKFYGFDMQAPRVAEANVLEYLRRVDPESRETAAKTFAVLGEWAANDVYEHGPAEIKRGVAESLAAILRRFDERKQEYIARSSLGEWTMVRQNMVIVKQAEVKLADQTGHFRDQAMAENVKWILDQEEPGTKIMLWAHNGHIAGDAQGYGPMGEHLREIFGGQAVLCGFVFQQGGFRAGDIDGDALRDFTVGPPPQGSLGATFAAIGAPLFAIDLRHLPGGKVADWFDAPHITWHIGGGYTATTPGAWFLPIRAARAFDMLIFVAKTTPSRPL